MMTSINLIYSDIGGVGQEYLPPQYTYSSSSANGTMTVKFRSDSCVGTGVGFELTISCLFEPPTPPQFTTNWVGDHYICQPFSATVPSVNGASYYKLGRSNDNGNGFITWVNGGITYSAGNSVTISGQDLPTAGTFRNYMWFAYDNCDQQSNIGIENYIRMGVPPSILNQPISDSICYGDTLDLTIIAHGGIGLSYQWVHSNGSIITNAIDSIYKVNSSGSFYCVINSAPANGCPNVISDTVSVVVNPILTSTFIATSPICSLGNSTVNYTGNGLGSASYNWNFNGGNAITTGGVQNFSVNWPSIGRYEITLSVTQNNCTSTQTIHPVFVSNLSTSTAVLNHVSCNGFSDASASIMPTNGLLPYTLLWNTSPPQNTPSISNLSAGTYYITVTDSINCTKTDSIIISEPEILQLNLSIIDESCSNSCNGEITANVTGGTLPYQYQWNNGGLTSKTISNLCIGNYLVTVTDSNHCTTSVLSTINTQNILNAQAFAVPTNSFVNQGVQFNYSGTSGVLYSWDFGDGTTSSIENPTHGYSNEGTYLVKLVVSSGIPNFCKDSTTLSIQVFVPSFVEIPNIFTPNNDNFNDVFSVKSAGLATEEMYIYNRWGNLIYHWSNVGGKWDGRNGSQDLEDGTYFYVFKAKGNDDKNYNLNGTIMLLK